MIVSLIGLILFVVASFFVVSYLKSKDTSDDCVGNWTEWDNCTNPCNHQSRTQRKYLITKPKKSEKGKDCPYPHEKTEYKDCPFTPCKVDCEGSWSEWSSCSNDCDVNQTVSRSFIVSLSNIHGGRECPSNIETRNCPVTACSRDCEYEWTAWDGTCDNAGCGQSNTLKRVYKIKNPAVGTGQQCRYSDGYVETSNCPFVPCELPCRGNWSEWSTCPTTCGESNKVYRTYTISNPSGNCPHANLHIEESNCPYVSCVESAQPCDGTWSDWETCDSNYSCGEQQIIYRHLSGASTECTNTIESNLCPIIQCPTVHCQGGFGEWDSNCDDMPCGMSNYRNRTYTVYSNAANGGNECTYNGEVIQTGFVDTQLCQMRNCPVDCVGEWSDWNTSCEALPKGQSNQIYKEYNIHSNAMYGGAACESTYGDKIYSNCPFVHAPIHCEGEWKLEGESCSQKACGDNVYEYHKYHITQSNEHQGNPCDHTHFEMKSNLCAPCDVCETEWSQWSACSNQLLNCGGTRTKNLYLTRQGQSCEYIGAIGDVVATSNESCQPCPVDCKGEWRSQDETACDNKICGIQHYETQYFHITENENLTGTCENRGKSNLSLCPYIPCCNIDCVGEWSNVPELCSNDPDVVHPQLVPQVYNILIPRSNEGALCSNHQGDIRTQYQITAPMYCPEPIHCVGEWNNVPEMCPSNCVREEQHRVLIPQQYRITRSNNNLGLHCDHSNGAMRFVYDTTDSNQYCSQPICPSPIDCIGGWCNLYNCAEYQSIYEINPSEVCGRSNMEAYQYIITQHRSNGGSNCPYQENALSNLLCPILPCPQACVGYWSNNEHCPSQCVDNNGEPIYSVYIVEKEAQNGGDDCPYSNLQIGSNVCDYCPTPCEGHIEYNGPSECPIVEGCKDPTIITSNLILTGRFVVNVPARNGGYCQYSNNQIIETVCSNNAPPCEVVDCDSEWINITSCPTNVSCVSPYDPKPTYMQELVQRIPAQYGGQECSNIGAVRSNTCDIPYCPVDCVGYWDPVMTVEQCPDTCIENEEEYNYKLNNPDRIPVRQYSISNYAMYGGSNCPHSNLEMDYSNCPVRMCTIECGGYWSNVNACPTDCHYEETNPNKQTQEYIVTQGGSQCYPENTTRLTDCPNNQCAQKEYFAVQNCAWGTDGTVCDSQQDLYPGGGTCFHKEKINIINTSNSNQSYSNVGVRCINPITRIGFTLGNTLGKSYMQADALCRENGGHLPKNIDELGMTCGTGEGYDAYHVWMDQTYNPLLVEF